MNKHLIKKFLNNQCSEEELHQVYAWLNNPENKDEITALLKTSWHHATADLPDADVDMEELKFKILKKLDLEEKTISNPRNQRTNILHATKNKDRKAYPNQSVKAKKSKHQFSWFRIIAFLILLEGVAFGAYKFLSTTDETTSSTVKTTQKGQKYTLYLKDGSKVILNSSSSLAYSNEYGETARDLILEGEAYFEVTKNTALPFRVSVNKLTTIALGTSFNIKASPNSDEIRVSLVTGKVQITNQNDHNQVMVLFPGDEMVYNKSKEQISKNRFDPRSTLAWKDGIIYFRDAALFEALGILEEWYGVEFEVKNPGKANSDYGNINGEFENESLKNVLTVMSFAKGFKYEMTGKKIIVEL